MRKQQADKNPDLNDLSRNPLKEFESWYADALSSGEKHPDSMTLSTCTKRGRPSGRIVLYKGLSKGRFCIFTNYGSRKGHELIENPFASLTFHWKLLDRQVRVEGRVFKMSRRESEKYFHSRPRTSQLGAWASKQSSPIPNREYLLARVKHFELMFQDRTIPIPENWGGFHLIPERIEFWIDGEFRLHDRFEYSRKVSASGTPGKWSRCRVSP